MIAITIRPRTDAKLDIYIADGANHEPLLNSSQGYEHHRDAIAVVERIFVADDNALTLAEIRELLADTPSAISPEHENLVTELNAILNTGRPAEPVTLTVHWRNGTTETRRIR